MRADPQRVKWPDFASLSHASRGKIQSVKRFIGYHFFHRIRRIAPRDAYSKTKNAMNLFTDEKSPSYRAFILSEMTKAVL
jgi:hypothetical protein